MNRQALYLTSTVLDNRRGGIPLLPIKLLLIVYVDSQSDFGPVDDGFRVRRFATTGGYAICRDNDDLDITNNGEFFLMNKNHQDPWKRMVVKELSVMERHIAGLKQTVLEYNRAWTRNKELNLEDVWKELPERDFIEKYMRSPEYTLAVP